MTSNTDRTTPTRRTSRLRSFLTRRAEDLIVLAAGLGLALPFLVPLS